MARKTAEPTFQAADGIQGSPAVLKEVFLTVNLGWCPLKIWLFIANITNEFIFRLDILRAYDASVDLGCQTLPGRGRGIVMEPRGGTLAFQPGSGQESSDTCIVRRDIDVQIGEPP
jgi:hypothetical protein